MTSTSKRLKEPQIKKLFVQTILYAKYVNCKEEITSHKNAVN